MELYKHTKYEGWTEIEGTWSVYGAQSVEEHDI